jgi:glucose-6-phosphate dehydrogenase assembly protein OpcA
MTDLAPRGLFSPEGVPLREPEEVERALTALWSPAAREATGDETATATRVSIANLLVVTSADEWNDVLAALGELSPLYPTRTIVLLIEGSESDAAPEPIRVSVSAICHVPQPGEAQVCCEQIVLRAGPSQVESLDNTVLPLLEADLPVMCWWRASPLAWPQLSAGIRSIAARWIVDNLSFEHLDSSDTCAVRELAWYRMAGLRELVAQMFDGCPGEVIESISQVHICTGGHHENEAQGIWLAAFLAGQLGWRRSNRRPLPVLLPRPHDRSPDHFGQIPLQGHRIAAAPPEDHKRQGHV